MRSISALAERGRALGYDRIFVDSIYHYNAASQKCFQSAGFVPFQSTEKGVSMVLEFK